MKKAKAPSYSKLDLILALLVLVEAVIIANLASKISLQGTIIDDLATTSKITNYKVEAQLRGCIDYGIRPCDNVAVKEWNKSHPDQALPVDIK